jgi:soluble lytic murein transglycosylase-like protein
VEGAPQIRTTRPHEPARAERYDALVVEHAGRHALRPELVRAVIQVESGFNPRARSPKGAMGLMQLMPETARELGVRHPYDPEDNIRGGTLYLRRLLDLYDGNEQLALAAYNAGAGAVQRHGNRIPPYRETRDYVKKVGRYAGRDTGLARVSAQRTGRLVLYRSIEIIGDRAVPRYATSPPESGTFDIIER